MYVDDRNNAWIAAADGQLNYIAAAAPRRAITLCETELPGFSFAADSGAVYCATPQEVVRADKRGRDVVRISGATSDLTAIAADTARREVYVGSRNGDLYRIARSHLARLTPRGPRPRPGGRLARHPVGHDAPRRHHALQPLNGRLQALRAEALYGLLQPRYDHEDRRGRRPPVDQDEPVRIRLLRPQAGPRAALLQRSRASELSDDQRRRALRRAGRRAVALDLQRARPAQGGAAAAAGRRLHARLRFAESAFGRDPRTDVRQPRPPVGRDARRRADRLRCRLQPCRDAVRA